MYMIIPLIKPPIHLSTVSTAVPMYSRSKLMLDSIEQQLQSAEAEHDAIHSFLIIPLSGDFRNGGYKSQVIIQVSKDHDLVFKQS